MAYNRIKKIDPHPTLRKTEGKMRDWKDRWWRVFITAFLHAIIDVWVRMDDGGSRDRIF